MTTLEKAYRQAGEGGRIFSVTFIKKNGEARRMAARHGVRKGVTGEGLKFDPRKKGLMVVFDMNKGFRMVPLVPERVISITGRGGKVFFNGGASSGESE